MSRDELVQGYLDGQLSRRVFVRRLVATGVAAATAVKYASMLEAMPAGATVADFYLVAEDFAFAPSPAQLVYGQGITIANHSHTRHRHSLTDASGLHLFDTGPIYVQDQKYVTLPAAGTYAVKCSEPVSSLHLKHIHPLPNGLEEIFKGFHRIFVVELNDEGFYGYGQLAQVLRARYCDPRIQGINKVDGLTWKVKEILDRARALAQQGK